VCRLAPVDEDGYHNIDFMLFPEYWGKKYGSEIVLGLKEYIIKYSKQAKGIQGTPNIYNIASQKLFEKIGCKKTGQIIFPKTNQSKWLQSSYKEVECFIYRFSKYETCG